MSSMSQHDLIEEVALRLGDPTGTEVPFKAIARLATRAYDRVARETGCIRRKATISLYTEADTYSLPSDFLRAFSVVFSGATGGTSAMYSRSSRYAVDSGPTSANTGVPSYSHYLIEADTSDGTGFKIRFWPYPNVENVVADSDTMTESGATVTIHFAAEAGSVEVGEDKSIVPDWVSEAVLLETVASAAPLPASKIKEQATFYRGLADRSIREARRQTNQHVDSPTPTPTPY